MRRDGVADRGEEEGEAVVGLTVKDLESEGEAGGEVGHGSVGGVIEA